MHCSHEDMISAAERGQLERRGIDRSIVQSWQRSMSLYHIDPLRREPPHVLPASQLKDHREPLEPLLHLARVATNDLALQIRDAGYIVLLANADSVAVDFINNPSRDHELKRAGLYLGACWSETREGTCAVGVCAAERKPITVHHSEHFRAPNIALTCSAAPILADDGSIVAVLDASALQSPDDKRSQHLVLQLVTATARVIESAYFLERHRAHWIIKLDRQPELMGVRHRGLLALDDEGRILAQTAGASVELQDCHGDLRGQLFAEVFGLAFEPFVQQALRSNDRPLELRSLRNARRCHALVQAPFRAHPPTIVAAERRQHPALPTPLERIGSGDSRMAANISRAGRIVNKGVPLMLIGETGTGKEVFARAFHNASSRADAAFVALNCAAIPESLIESELFGYRDGAFTGARAKGARGKLEQAHGGTLFLDEVGDMALPLQTRLLRVLSEREVVPLGAERAVRVDLQLICATHRDLADMVDRGLFREDLYYRLCGLTLELPPLREREDRVQLIRQLLNDEAKALDSPVQRIADNAMTALLSYPWPGNVRQLRSVLRAAIAQCDGAVLGVQQLPAGICGAQRATAPIAAAAGGYRQLRPPRELPCRTETAGEVAQMQDLLLRHRWNLSAAARELGLSRSTMYRRLLALGIAVAAPERDRPDA